MVAFFPSLSDNLRTWALSQPLFFIASAPLNGKHVNVSPKGYPQGCFSIINPNLCAYVDRTGSGCETISHVYENGRATLMFCSFGNSPRIMRLFCNARIVEWDSPDFETWMQRMKLAKVDSARCIVVCDIFQVQTSCGYSVPKVRKMIADADGNLPADVEKQDIGVSGFEERPTLLFFNSKREREGTAHQYQAEMNTKSLDGLPGLRAAQRDAGKNVLVERMKAYVRRVLAQSEGIAFGFVMALLVYYALALAASAGWGRKGTSTGP
ncbi:pyridoxamine phosphate oxidase family protein [Pseudomassariella vexata]|uniref:Pyridoxamine phosphate oxidase family protein n=1 Tax=Pseudomassariella vexata TaxID=1141098 RepID=A0A1Y2DLH3_9PEZI|nr:pyridoxamine phosphate oxidase family protein [Pseudomassariella vexata]ORY60081.1 pyridoxamine phosphate oxidase family protein [Pseudomassariella vexata]